LATAELLGAVMTTRLPTALSHPAEDPSGANTSLPTSRDELAADSSWADIGFAVFLLMLAAVLDAIAPSALS
jgi:hypothetical protein